MGRTSCNIYESPTVDEPTPLEGRNVTGMGAVTRVTGPTPDMQAPGEGVSAWRERAVHERDLWRCSVAVCGKTSNVRRLVPA